MKLSKCTVTVVSAGPGGLSVKRPCGKPAIRRFGKRKYCSQHLNQERERLHLPWLGARLFHYCHALVRDHEVH